MIHRSAMMRCWGWGIATSSKHKIQCFIFCKQKIPPVSWLLLSPQRPFAFAGAPKTAPRNDAFMMVRYGGRTQFVPTDVAMTHSWGVGDCHTSDIGHWFAMTHCGGADVGAGLDPPFAVRRSSVGFTGGYGIRPYGWRGLPRAQCALAMTQNSKIARHPEPVGTLA